eukprot:COSAG06_NODE_2569_length_6653_cov_3.860085_3_plen_87_part_00
MVVDRPSTSTQDHLRLRLLLQQLLLKPAPQQTAMGCCRLLMLGTQHAQQDDTSAPPPQAFVHVVRMVSAREKFSFDTDLRLRWFHL